MLVQFETNHEETAEGFSAKLHYTPINTICKSWLNITTGDLISPDHPNMNCSWVITASIFSTIFIEFHAFEVKIIINELLFD